MGQANQRTRENRRHDGRDKLLKKGATRYCHQKGQRETSRQETSHQESAHQENKGTKEEKPVANGRGRENCPKIQTVKKTTLSSRLSKARNIIGVFTITTGQACGHCIIPMIVKQARPPQVPQPMPIWLPWTPWTVTPTRND